jgi:hypothetical protein
MMALASEDLWTKFGLALDKRGPPLADCCQPAGMFGRDTSSRSLLLVNSRQRLRESAVLPPAIVKDEMPASLVPDIRDLISGGSGSSFDHLSGGCLDDLADLNMDGGIDMEFDETFLLGPDILLGLDSDETDPLRHDCMWSGVGGGGSAALKAASATEQPPSGSSCSSSYFGDQLLLELGESQQLLLGCSPTAPSCSVAGPGEEPLSCFGAVATPLRSETSDLEETSSDLEEEVLSDRTTRAAAERRAAVPTHSDHSYIATPTSGDGCNTYVVGRQGGGCREATSRRTFCDILTPDESSSSSSSEEDDEKRSSDDKTMFRIPVLPDYLHRRLADTTGSPRRPVGKQPVGVPLRSSPAITSTKFRFHIKYKPSNNNSKAGSGSGTAGSRSLLRGGPPGPNRTCYTRRQGAGANRLVKDAFFPASSLRRYNQPQSLEVGARKGGGLDLYRKKPGESSSSSS